MKHEIRSTTSETNPEDRNAVACRRARFEIWVLVICACFGFRVSDFEFTAQAADTSSWYAFEPRNTAEPGEIVVALVGGEATVKRLIRRRGQWVLQPENPAHEPIVPPQHDLRLVGKVIEVRRFHDGEGPSPSGS